MMHYAMKEGLGKSNCRALPSSYYSGLIMEKLQKINRDDKAGLIIFSPMI